MASLHKTVSAAASKNKKPPGRKATQSAWVDFKQSLVRLPDLSSALACIADYISGCWQRDNALDYKIAQKQQNDLDRQFKASSKTLVRLETKEANTQRHIPSVKMYGKPSKDGTLQWNQKDRVLISVTLFGAITAVCLGAVNVFANLQAAELPVFTESPWLAVTLSFLLPVGSLAIKFMSSMFEYDRSRQRFAQTIYGLTLCLVLIWSYLFAQSFANITGSGINFDALLSGADHGWALVWTQLLTELLAGSALFIAAESISAKYNPTSFSDNPAYTDVKTALDEHRPVHIALRDQLAELEGKLAAMDADRETMINQHVANFLGYRERFNAVNNPNDSL